MITTIKISADSPGYARGRNGAFMPRYVDLFLSSDGVCIFMDLQSCRHGKQSPITIKLPRITMRQIARAMLKVSKESI